MNRMTYLMIYAAYVFVLCVFMSCERDCVCHFNDGNNSKAIVEVDVNWDKFDKEKVSGMTVMCFSEDTAEPKKLLTNDINVAQFLLPEGFHDFLVFNQSEDEYSNISFSGMDDIKTATLNAVDYQGKHWLGNDVRVIEEPEWLAVGKMEDAIVSCDMVAESNGNPCDCNKCCCEILHTGKTFKMGTIKPENVIYTFDVKINLAGIQNLKAARASITGLADIHNIVSGSNSETCATQLLQSWTVDKQTPYFGHIDTSIRTFGLPCVKQPLILALQLMLADGKTIYRYTRDVSPYISVDEINKIISLDFTISEALPDIQPPSSGGFEATVSQWADAEDLDIKL